MAIRKKILVIDDEVIWHGLIKRLLCPLDYDVYAAGSCAEGIRLAGQVRPDCILLDFHLQDGDAGCVCEAIHGNAALCKIPILIFSSDPVAEVEAYSTCRAYRFLYKGTDIMAGLCKAIEEVLSPAQREPAGP